MLPPVLVPLPPPPRSSCLDVVAQATRRCGRRGRVGHPRTRTATRCRRSSSVPLSSSLPSSCAGSVVAVVVRLGRASPAWAVRGRGPRRGRRRPRLRRPWPPPVVVVVVGPDSRVPPRRLAAANETSRSPGGRAGPSCCRRRHPSTWANRPTLAAASSALSGRREGGYSPRGPHTAPSLILVGSPRRSCDVVVVRGAWSWSSWSPSRWSMRENVSITERTSNHLPGMSGPTGGARRRPSKTINDASTRDHVMCSRE